MIYIDHTIKYLVRTRVQKIKVKTSWRLTVGRGGLTWRDVKTNERAVSIHRPSKATPFLKEVRGWEAKSMAQMAAGRTDEEAEDNVSTWGSVNRAKIIHNRQNGQSWVIDHSPEAL